MNFRVSGKSVTNQFKRAFNPFSFRNGTAVTYMTSKCKALNSNESVLGASGISAQEDRTSIYILDISSWLLGSLVIFDRKPFTKANRSSGFCGLEMRKEENYVSSCFRFLLKLRTSLPSRRWNLWLSDRTCCSKIFHILVKRRNLEILEPIWTIQIPSSWKKWFRSQPIN